MAAVLSSIPNLTLPLVWIWYAHCARKFFFSFQIKWKILYSYNIFYVCLQILLKGSDIMVVSLHKGLSFNAIMQIWGILYPPSPLCPKNHFFLIASPPLSLKLLFRNCSSNSLVIHWIFHSLSEIFPSNLVVLTTRCWGWTGVTFFTSEVYIYMGARDILRDCLPFTMFPVSHDRASQWRFCYQRDLSRLVWWWTSSGQSSSISI